MACCLAVHVHPASVQDPRDGAEALLREARRELPVHRASIIGDAGYQGQKMQAAVARTGSWELQIVRRCERHRFVVLPKRWIVERTLAWISRCRRLARAGRSGVLLARVPGQESGQRMRLTTNGVPRQEAFDRLSALADLRSRDRRRGPGLDLYLGSARLTGTHLCSVVGHTVVTIPFVIVTTLAGLRHVDRNLEVAATDRG